MISPRSARPFLLACALAATDLVSKYAVDMLLTRPIRLGPVFLVLVHNHAFLLGLGASLPAWIITAAVGVITVTVATQLWRGALAGPAGPLVLAGALSNLLDRAVDGSVVDYLQVPGWPAFNLADAFLIAGALLLGAGMTPVTEAGTPRWNAPGGDDHAAPPRTEPWR